MPAGAKEQAVGVAGERASLRWAEEQAVVIGVAEFLIACGAADGFKLDVRCSFNLSLTGTGRRCLCLVTPACCLSGGSEAGNGCGGCGVGSVAVDGLAVLTAGSGGAGTPLLPDLFPLGGEGLLAPVVEFFLCLAF